MSLEDLSFGRGDTNSLENVRDESFIDTENNLVSVSQSSNRQELCYLESEEYRKSVAKVSAGAIIGCFVSGGVILVNYLNFESSFIYTLAGAGFVLSLRAGIYNFRRDFEIKKFFRLFKSSGCPRLHSSASTILA